MSKARTAVKGKKRATESDAVGENQRELVYQSGQAMDNTPYSLSTALLIALCRCQRL